MKAMIFAAGLGTRLNPLTLGTPKALIEIKGKTLLEYNIEKLINFGIHEIIINVHHFPDQIIRFIQKKSFDVPIYFSDERKKLLDTGGALKKASSFFNEKTFLLYNVDVICDIDLFQVIKFHNQSKPIATLVVRKRKSNRYFYFNNENELCGWENTKSGEKIIFVQDAHLSPLAFSGIHIVDSDIFKLMPKKNIFSMTELYLKIGRIKKIKAYIDNQSSWVDVGKIEQFENMNNA